MKCVERMCDTKEGQSAKYSLHFPPGIGSVTPGDSLEGQSGPRREEGSSKSDFHLTGKIRTRAPHDR